VFACGNAFRTSFDGCYFNALVGWMFHGRAYAGGRFVFCIVMLPWVRLEARPFHIPPRIALVGWLGCFEWTNLCSGETTIFGRCATRTRHHLNRNPNMQNKQ